MGATPQGLPLRITIKIKIILNSIRIIIFFIVFILIIIVILILIFIPSSDAVRSSNRSLSVIPLITFILWTLGRR